MNAILANACSQPSVDYTFNVASRRADATAPVITPNITGTLGTNGWYTSDVGLTWTVTDLESSISSSTDCGPSNVTIDTAGHDVHVLGDERRRHEQRVGHHQA